MIVNKNKAQLFDDWVQRETFLIRKYRGTTTDNKPDTRRSKAFYQQARIAKNVIRCSVYATKCVKTTHTVRKSHEHDA